MTGARSFIGPLLVIGLIAVAFGVARGGPPGLLAGDGARDDGARYRLTDDRPSGARATTLPAAAAPRFAPGIAASDQQVVLDAIAGARPGARRLVDLVAGLVTFSIGEPGGGVIGQTRPTSGGYDVVLDLGGVYRSSGMRGVRRLVLHELAHVIDHALVPSALELQLDAATPQGFGCDEGRSGGCAAREERFAESFAKWATDDIGNDLYIGYRVPPPTSLSGWGDPLAALTR